MQFKVPQFIDIEDKLFGPFSFSQFAYLVGGAGLIFIIYKILPIWIGIFLMIPVAILTGLLVFYKINNKPFIFYLQAGLIYLISGKLFVWKQRLIKPDKNKKEDEEEKAPNITTVIPMAREGKLKDISWSLDVGGEDSGSK